MLKFDGLAANVLELLVSVRVRPAFARFPGALEAVATLME